MKIHHFDSKTFEYLETSNARPDPLEEGNYLIPAFAVAGDLPSKKETEMWVLEDGVIVAVPIPIVLPEPEIVEKFEGKQTKLIKQIDRDVDDIIRAVIGNRQSEYERAEDEATVYKAAGYTGTVPVSVSSWAAAKTWTNQQATDDILVAATAWRNAQASMRGNRLLCKENAKKSTTDAELATVQAQWAAFLAALKQAMGL